MTLHRGERAEHLVEQVHELLAERVRVEKSGDRTQQVAEKISLVLIVL
jgi:hypothetical protein